MKFDVLFFENKFLLAKKTGWQWGPGEDGTIPDARFELVRDIYFGDDPIVVNGVSLQLVDGNVEAV
jgi:hypothetical protein